MGGHLAGAYFGEAAPPPITLAPSDEGPNRQRVLAALRELGEAGPFYHVEYDEDRVPTLADEVSPLSVEANEVSARFAEPRLNRRADLRERRSWPFEMLMEFPAGHETTVEEWEQRLRTPLLIPESVLSGETRTSRSLRLLIQDVTYTHPPRGGSARGTQVVANFTVELAPL